MWDPKNYEARYGKRSANEIILSRQTNYMNPCLDWTMATITMLKERGFETVLVAEEKIGEHTKAPFLHFAIEIKNKNKIYTIDFQTRKTLVYYSGKYNPDKYNPPLKKHRHQQIQNQCPDKRNHPASVLRD